ncbi:hypothetical protein MPH_03290 [Macrophomina phaseolina MS6]|uniref:Uncharacterized protein n=1 Tax=Macrophomina phaseolina (strain MS6) TaxID=1126212 RepID=K2S326_MACPH|nr:hypothetical protein MPH_03290 [Macrophomina phaseolina MS6]
MKVPVQAHPDMLSSSFLGEPTYPAVLLLLPFPFFPPSLPPPGPRPRPGAINNAWTDLQYYDRKDSEGDDDDNDEWSAGAGAAHLAHPASPLTGVELRQRDRALWLNFALMLGKQTSPILRHIRALRNRVSVQIYQQQTQVEELLAFRREVEVMSVGALGDAHGGGWAWGGGNGERGGEGEVGGSGESLEAMLGVVRQEVYSRGVLHQMGHEEQAVIRKDVEAFAGQIEEAKASVTAQIKKIKASMVAQDEERRISMESVLQ